MSALEGFGALAITGHGGSTVDKRQHWIYRPMESCGPFSGMARGCYPFTGGWRDDKKRQKK
jgi:hypothetical protein